MERQITVYVYRVYVPEGERLAYLTSDVRVNQRDASRTAEDASKLVGLLRELSTKYGLPLATVTHKIPKRGSMTSKDFEIPDVITPGQLKYFVRELRKELGIVEEPSE